MAIRLSADERELLLDEVAQAVEQVRAPALKVAYGELLTAVDLGEVPDDLQEPLQNLLEIGLESGRIRQVHHAHAEMAARRLWARLPRGASVRESVQSVNEMLQSLEGETVQELSVAAAGPGAYTLTVETGQGKLLVQLDRHGVRVRSLEVGG